MTFHKYTPEERLELFWSRIDKSGGPDACWIWTASHNAGGYGNMWWDERVQPSHRISYELAYGAIPEGLQVCHHCDNRPCCNPTHFFLGRHLENNRDKESKGRGNQPRGEHNHLHKLTEADVIEIRRLATERKLKYKDIGAKFGVTRGAISLVVRRVWWKHVLP